MAHPHPIDFMRLRRHVALATIALSLAACRNPSADAQILDQMRQLGDELNAGRQEAAGLAEQIDSLRIVVARQDTLLRQLASMANLPVPTR
ncbi:MAG: hypothetical protein V4550_09595 [Gemmatimonadota bacterium]